MGRALALAMLVFVAPAAIAGQTLVVLHIRAVLTDPTGQATPVGRHALLISDNPPTREPRRVFTSVDGTADVRLRPGNYTVESDQPVAFQGSAYRWTRSLDVVAGRESALELTIANATVEAIAPGPAGDAAPLATDTSLLLRQWHDSVVELWTPTAHASGFLFDSNGVGEAGGTGQAFDWSRIPAGIQKPFVLAGGLTPENVFDAICATLPWGVDVSSGLESAPGIKDGDKMRHFVEEVRRADCHTG